MVIPHLFQWKHPHLGNHGTCPTLLPPKPIPAAKHCQWQRQICMILPRDTVYSPGQCFLTGRSQAYGLVVHPQQGAWPSCFGLAHTSASAQFRGVLAELKAGPTSWGSVAHMFPLHCAVPKEQCPNSLICSLSRESVPIQLMLSRQISTFSTSSNES